MLSRHALRQSRTVLRSLTARTSGPFYQHAYTRNRNGRPTLAEIFRPSWPSVGRLASTSTSTIPPAPSSSLDVITEASSSSAIKDAANRFPEEGSPDDRFSTTASEELLQAPSSSTSQSIGKIERRLSITFTCTVPNCGERSSHEFSRLAYERGIVLCQCPACLTRHLIGEQS